LFSDIDEAVDYPQEDERRSRELHEHQIAMEAKDRALEQSKREFDRMMEQRIREDEEKHKARMLELEKMDKNP
jgi:hypothetical protein